MRVVNMFCFEERIMRAFYTFLIVFFIFITICSCGRPAKTINLTTNVVFPSSLNLFSYGYSDYEGVDDDYKLLIVYDSLVCSNCVINRLVIWKDILEYADSTDNLSVVMIFSPAQKEKTVVEKELRDNPIGYPIYLDEQNDFIKENNIGKGFSVCLLDNYNNVVLYGNPINNDELWNKYKDIINN